MLALNSAESKLILLEVAIAVSSGVFYVQTAASWSNRSPSDFRPLVHPDRTQQELTDPAFPAGFSVSDNSVVVSSRQATVLRGSHGLTAKAKS
jgi:hypothetical protein